MAGVGRALKALKTPPQRPLSPFSQCVWGLHYPQILPEGAWLQQLWGLRDSSQDTGVWGDLITTHDGINHPGVYAQVPAKVTRGRRLAQSDPAWIGESGASWEP